MNSTKTATETVLADSAFDMADASTDRTAAKYLAVELDRLVSLPLDTPESVGRWDIEADEVMTALDMHFSHFLVERQARRFFADADLRQKDAAYRQHQHQYISDYVKRLRNGHLTCQPDN